MKAAVFHQHGSTGNIRIEEFPDPEIGPGDCLVKVKAVALNGFEPMILGKTHGAANAAADDSRRATSPGKSSRWEPTWMHNAGSRAIASASIRW